MGWDGIEFGGIPWDGIGFSIPSSNSAWFPNQNSTFCFQDVEGQKVAFGGFRAWETQWRCPFYCTTRGSVGLGYGAPMVPDPKFYFLFSWRRRPESCTRGFSGMGNFMAVSVLLYDPWFRGCGVFHSIQTNHTTTSIPVPPEWRSQLVGRGRLRITCELPFMHSTWPIKVNCSR